MEYNELPLMAQGMALGGGKSRRLFCFLPPFPPNLPQLSKHDEKPSIPFF